MSNIKRDSSPSHNNIESIKPVKFLKRSSAKSGINEELPTRDMYRLTMSQELSDTIVEKYFKLLEDGCFTKRTHTFPTVVWQMWGLSDFRRVFNWSTYRQIDFGVFDLIFMPICANRHWTLLVVDMKERTIRYMNSLYTASVLYRQKSHIINFLNGIASIDSKVAKEFRTYKVLHDIDNTPQQPNAIDCGVYICLFARALMFNFELSKYANIPSFREHMSVELETNQLVLFGYEKLDRTVIDVKPDKPTSSWYGALTGDSYRESVSNATIASMTQLANQSQNDQIPQSILDHMSTLTNDNKLNALEYRTEPLTATRPTRKEYLKLTNDISHVLENKGKQDRGAYFRVPVKFHLTTPVITDIDYITITNYADTLNILSRAHEVEYTDFVGLDWITDDDIQLDNLDDSMLAQVQLMERLRHTTDEHRRDALLYDLTKNIENQRAFDIIRKQMNMSIKSIKEINRIINKFINKQKTLTKIEMDHIKKYIEGFQQLRGNKELSDMYTLNPGEDMLRNRIDKIERVRVMRSRARLPKTQANFMSIVRMESALTNKIQIGETSQLEPGNTKMSKKNDIILLREIRDELRDQIRDVETRIIFNKND